MRLSSILFLPVTVFLSSLQGTLNLWIMENTKKIQYSNNYDLLTWFGARLGVVDVNSLKLSAWIIAMEDLVSLGTGGTRFPVHLLCVFSSLFLFPHRNMIADTSWCVKKELLVALKLTVEIAQYKMSISLQRDTYPQAC